MGPTRLSTLHHTYSFVMCSNKRSKTASSGLSSKRLDSFLCIFATSVHASHQYSICGEHQISKYSELDREADAAHQHSTKFHHHGCGCSDSDVDFCFARAIFGQDSPLV